MIRLVGHKATERMGSKGTRGLRAALLHAGLLSFLVTSGPGCCHWNDVPVDPFGCAFCLAFFLAMSQMAAPAQESIRVLMPHVPALM